MHKMSLKNRIKVNEKRRRNLIVRILKIIIYICESKILISKYIIQFSRYTEMCTCLNIVISFDDTYSLIKRNNPESLW